jgi:tellurite methyltransferase
MCRLLGEDAPETNCFTPLEESVTRALDLAAGWGQNGLWLAEQGYNVDIMDISRVALQRARAEMAVRNLRNINLLQMDVDDLQLEPEQYDLLCVFRYLKRHLFPLLKLTTRSGGRIIYETFNRRYLEIVPDFNQDYLLEIGELRSFFSNWQIRHYEETDHNARIVAIKPH